MEFLRELTLVIIWGAGLITLLLLYLNTLVAKKLIGQFNCENCGKKQDELREDNNGTTVCNDCGENINRQVYRYKSTFFGSVSIRGHQGNRIRKKAIKWIVTDMILMLIILLIISVMLYLLHFHQ